MRRTETSSVTWRKSTYSGYNGGCVEVARTPEAVAVRDSKDPDGPVLVVPRAAFAQFVGNLQ